MGERPTAPRDRGARTTGAREPRTTARGRRLATSSASAQLKGARAPGTWSRGGEGPALAFASVLSLDGDGSDERARSAAVAPAQPATARARPAATTTTRSSSPPEHTRVSTTTTTPATKGTTRSPSSATASAAPPRAPQGTGPCRQRRRGGRVASSPLASALRCHTRPAVAGGESHLPPLTARGKT